MSRGVVMAVLAGARRSVVALLCSAHAGVIAQATSPEPIRLALDQTASATQRAEEPITYLFAAHAGASYLIEVEQHGLDFIVTVENPSGGTQSYNSPLKRDEREYALLDAAVSGDYRITVVSNELTNAAGSHSIRVSDLAAIARGDAERDRAWRAMTSAATVNAAADRARLSQAVAQEQVDALKQTSRDAYSQARDSWHKLGEPRLQAHALYSMAMLEYWDLYNRSGAADIAQMSAAAYSGVDEDLQARARFLHAYALVDAAVGMETEAANATFELALMTFAEMIARYEQRDDEHGLAEVLNFVGYTHHLRGNFAAAEPAWLRSASLFARIGDWREELNVRQNIAGADSDKGYLGRAIETFRHILAQVPTGKDPEFEANVLENLGAVHRDFGNIDDALETYSRALSLRQALGDGSHVSQSLRGLGSTYYVSGEYELAKSFLQRALDAARHAEDSRSQAAVLTYLGNIAFLESEYETALALHREAERLTNSAQGRAVRRLLIAKDLAAAERHAEALATAEQVLTTSIDLPLVLADAHTQVGRSLVAMGEHSAGADHLQQAASLYRELRLQEGEADALNGLALAAQATGSLTQAIAYGEAAIDRIENLRVKVSAPELRALYSAAQRKFYETQIGILMSNGGDTSEERLYAALRTSERARARVLVDLLGTTRTDSNDPADEALVERRTRLSDDLAARSVQRDRLLARPLANSETDRQLDGLVREISSLENELTLLDTRSRVSPLASDVLTRQEIQQLIGPRAVLLQYALGEHRSFVWVVSNNSIQAVALPARESIEAAVRSALTSLQGRVSPSAHRNAELQALSDQVLTPIAQLIQADRVLVAADGALHYVPFAVLPVIRGGVSEPLIATREVVSVPSMSALAAQRARRSTEQPAKTLALFADPIFERTDERFTHSEAATEALLDDLPRRSSEALRRLPYSAREARDISALVPATKRLVSEGFDAHRDAVLHADLRDYRFVHFATHGVVDSRYPALSALALSQFDRDGNRLAGLLRLNDIYGLDLNADVVVLSACDTALGREIRGEGLVGLTQAFLYAGSRSLVLSLWQVSDAATAVLMARFYEHMIRDGASAAEALKLAQLSMAAEPRWADPYYWGAFILLGDVR